MAMTQNEIERLADAIHERMAKAVLKLPAEWGELVLRNYMMPPIQVPMKDTNHNYFLINGRVDNSGNLILRIHNMFGELLKEWAMEV